MINLALDLGQTYRRNVGYGAHCLSQGHYPFGNLEKARPPDCSEPAGADCNVRKGLYVRNPEASRKRILRQARADRCGQNVPALCERSMPRSAAPGSASNGSSGCQLPGCAWHRAHRGSSSKALDIADRQFPRPACDRRLRLRLRVPDLRRLSFGWSRFRAQCCQIARFPRSQSIVNTKCPEACAFSLHQPAGRHGGVAVNILFSARQHHLAASGGLHEIMGGLANPPLQRRQIPGSRAWQGLSHGTWVIGARPYTPSFKPARITRSACCSRASSCPHIESNLGWVGLDALGEPVWPAINPTEDRRIARGWLSDHPRPWPPEVLGTEPLGRLARFPRPKSFGNCRPPWPASRYEAEMCVHHQIAERWGVFSLHQLRERALRVRAILSSQSRSSSQLDPADPPRPDRRRPFDETSFSSPMILPEPAHDRRPAQAQTIQRAAPFDRTRPRASSPARISGCFSTESSAYRADFLGHQPCRQQ